MLNDRHEIVKPRGNEHVHLKPNTHAIHHDSSLDSTSTIYIYTKDRRKKVVLNQYLFPIDLLPCFDDLPFTNPHAHKTGMHHNWSVNSCPRKVHTILFLFHK